MGYAPLPPPAGLLEMLRSYTPLSMIFQAAGLTAHMPARLGELARRQQEAELRESLLRVRCEYCGVLVSAHKGTCSQCGAALPDAEQQRLIDMARQLETRRPPEIRPDPKTMVRGQR